MEKRYFSHLFPSLSLLYIDKTIYSVSLPIKQTAIIISNIGERHNPHDRTFHEITEHKVHINLIVLFTLEDAFRTNIYQKRFE
jgi:hypothetical protein